MGRSRRDKELDADGVVGEVIFPDADAVTGFTGAPFGAGLGSIGRLDPGLRPGRGRTTGGWRNCAPTAPSAGSGSPSSRSWSTSTRPSKRSSGRPSRPAGRDDPRDVAAYPPYHDRRYDPFWAACADANLPVHIHSGAATMSSTALTSAST